MAIKTDGGKIGKVKFGGKKKGKAKKSSISKTNKHYVKPYRGQGR